MLKSLKRLFKRKPKFKFVEGVDFFLMPNLQAAKDGDPHPWDIAFLGRIIKVHSVKIPQKVSEDGNYHIDIKATVRYGNEMTPYENNQFGDLLMELVQRNILAKDS